MTALNWLAVPPVTTTLLMSKPVTSSLKLNVNSTSLLAVPASLSLMVSVGAVVSAGAGVVVSTAWLTFWPTAKALPAKSLAAPAATATVIGVVLLAVGVTTTV